MNPHSVGHRTTNNGAPIRGSAQRRYGAVPANTEGRDTGRDGPTISRLPSNNANKRHVKRDMNSATT